MKIQEKEQSEMTAEPRNFYFNGEQLPEYVSHWGLCGYNYKAIAEMNDCNAYFSELDLFIIHCTIDHVRTIESYDWEVFCGGAQQILIFHLENRKKTLKNIKNVLNQSHIKNKKPPVDIYEELTQGLRKMTELALSDQQAFWTTGSGNDRQDLLEHMRRSKLPLDHPEYLLPPHKASLLLDFQNHYAEQTETIHKLLSG